MSRRRLIAITVGLLLAAAACGGGNTAAGSKDAPTESLRLGYFPNLTHATAIVGVEKGIFAKHLGDTKLDTKTFNAGGDAVTALFGDQIDATFIGPSPTINAWDKSKGAAIRIVAGATSGGAYLVVNKDIDDAAALEGKTLASPQLGNTQDVALRAWLATKGLETDTQGGGDVEVKPQENAVSLETFRSGDIDGAWVPEPWATRLVQEGGGKVLVDEATLWPNGRYVTTHLIVRTAYLKDHADTVKKLIEGLIEADDFVNDNEADAKALVNKGIENVTSKTIAPAVLDAAWKNLTFTIDPVATSMKKNADDAAKLGLIEKVDLTGIYDLTILNSLLKADGREELEGL
jgi:NitT/TauT family transport system substrate-binding protein